MKKKAKEKKIKSKCISFFVTDEMKKKVIKLQKELGLKNISEAMRACIDKVK